MKISATILNQQLSDMQKQFTNLDANDFEGKVSNIKQRIFLMHKKLGENRTEDKGNPVHVVSTPEKDTRAEMNDLRKKLMPKVKTVEDELDQSDRELADAIDRALAKVK